MHTQTSPQPSYHIPGGFEALYQRSSSLTIYSDNEEIEIEGNDGFLDNSYPGCGIYGKLYKSRCLSGSLSSSQSDDSLEGRYTSLEDRHFEKALSQGVFNGVSAYNKRERKRSYRKVRKKAHSESSCDTFDSATPMNTTSRNDFLFYSKQLSASTNFDAYERENTHSGSARRKESLPKRGERFRKELSNCGIDLHDANDKMNIEEIYELQQRFFTGLKLTSDNDVLADQLENTQSNKQQRWKKKRCVSSIN